MNVFLPEFQKKPFINIWDLIYTQLLWLSPEKQTLLRSFCKRSAGMIMFTLSQVLHSGVRAESKCSW